MQSKSELKNKMGKLKDMEVFFYNGFYKPEIIKLDDLIISHNYRGDVTQEVIEELEDYLMYEDVESIKEDQPLGARYGVWFSPTLEILGEFNKSIGLEAGDWIEGVI